MLLNGKEGQNVVYNPNIEQICCFINEITNNC